MIDAIILFMDSNDDITGPINLGNPNEISIKELAEKILKLTNSNSKMTFNELPLDDPVIRRPDINQAKSKLNWEPKINLEAGLLKTINYFASNY